MERRCSHTGLPRYRTPAVLPSLRVWSYGSSFCSIFLRYYDIQPTTTYVSLPMRQFQSLATDRSIHTRNMDSSSLYLREVKVVLNFTGKESPSRLSHCVCGHQDDECDDDLTRPEQLSHFTDGQCHNSYQSASGKPMRR
jgi:hypothetical protein